MNLARAAQAYPLLEKAVALSRASNKEEKTKKLFALLLMLTSVLTACQNQVVNENVATAKQKRPNIVFIMSDDHAFQALSAYGHSVSKLAPTPNIDRIANNGVRFDRAFVTNSLCGPSRATMLTGKFGHLNGLSYNGQKFDEQQPTWPKLLKQVGYQTAVVGKWHIGKTPEGLDFDFWKILNDQGEYYNPDFITKDGVERIEGYVTDLKTDFSLDWLDKQRDKSKPFALLIHHKAPHRNWMPALRHLTRYENTKFPIPDTYFDNYEGRKAASEQEMNIYRDMYLYGGMSLLAAVFVWKLVPETKGKTLEAMESLWRGRAKAPVTRGSACPGETQASV